MISVSFLGSQNVPHLSLIAVFFASDSHPGQPRHTQFQESPQLSHFLSFGHNDNSSINNISTYVFYVYVFLRNDLFRILIHTFFSLTFWCLLFHSLLIANEWSERVWLVLDGTRRGISLPLPRYEQRKKKSFSAHHVERNTWRSKEKVRFGCVCERRVEGGLPLPLVMLRSYALSEWVRG